MTSLPASLLDAIWRAAGGDEAEADRLAHRWQVALPQMEAAAERIRAQVREWVCHCQLAPESITEDGRCGRCFGQHNKNLTSASDAGYASGRDGGREVTGDG